MLMNASRWKRWTVCFLAMASLLAASCAGEGPSRTATTVTRNVGAPLTLLTSHPGQQVIVTPLEGEPVALGHARRPAFHPKRVLVKVIGE